MNVPIIDHLIISEKEFYSFEDKSLLRKIEQGSHFDLTFSTVEGLFDEIEKKSKQIERANKQSAKKIKEAEQKVKQQERFEVSRKALKEKIPVSQIIKLTGLTKKQIEGLKEK